MSATPVYRRRSARLGAAVGAVLLSGGLSFLVLSSPAEATRQTATAVLHNASGEKVGRVSMLRSHGHTTVIATLKANANVTAAQFHGFHVHANDDPSNGDGCVADPAQPAKNWFVSADGHLKADAQTHGAHTGDMPSLLVNADGTASVRFTDDNLRPSDLIGKAIVLHAGPDNFGNVPVGTAADQYTANSPDAVTKTQKTGNAGDRMACGVIGR